MKRLILATVASAVMFTSPMLNAGMWDSMMTSDFPEVKALAYKVAVYGFDMRVYEWKSQTVPNTICIAAFPGGTAGGFQVECTRVK